jgi:hypothetical protein
MLSSCGVELLWYDTHLQVTYFTMKTLIALIVVALIAGTGFVLWQPNSAPLTTAQDTEAAQSGSTVAASESTVNWSAKKPLIDGYVNSGTIDVKEGTITVAGTQASGSFTIDMDTIHVGLTAKKPGQEGTLEGTSRVNDGSTLPSSLPPHSSSHRSLLAPTAPRA